MKAWFDLNVFVLNILAITIVGCGITVPKVPRPGIHTDLLPYVHRFERLGQERHGPRFILPKMDIDLGDTSDMLTDESDLVTVGWCRRSKVPQIMISEEHFISYSEANREQLMFHELGRCVLGRSHEDSVTSENVPMSLMSSIMMDDETYIENRDYYIDELFSVCSVRLFYKPSDDDTAVVASPTAVSQPEICKGHH